jgi:hypothetical protein
MFTIADAREMFTLTNVAIVGEEYTLSFWVKSAASGSIIIDGSTVTTSTTWERYVNTYTATNTDIVFDFDVAGTYYIYHLQLEVGNMATDWDVASEDIDDAIETVESSVAALTVKSDEIRASVSAVDNSLKDTKRELAELTIHSNEISASVGTVKDDLKGTRDELAAVKLKSDNFTVEIQKINTDGVNRVSTTTGIFDNAGLTVDNSDSPTKTQITPDGMTVYQKNMNGEVTERLVASSEGVDATNLHATTYLIVGGRSRFEKYGNNRTGCFWIGG